MSSRGHMLALLPLADWGRSAPSIVFIDMAEITPLQ